MFRRCFLLLCIVMPIFGCTTPEPVGPVTYKQFNSGYQKVELLLSGSFTGTTTEIYLRPGKLGDNLEICGFYIRHGGDEDQWMAEWLAESGVTLNGEEIVSAKFINSQYQFENAKAACAVTNIKFQESQMNGFLSISDGCHFVIMFGFRRALLCSELAGSIPLMKETFTAANMQLSPPRAAGKKFN